MRLALCLEQTLGHRTHSQNLVRMDAGGHGTIDIVEVAYRRGRVPIPWAIQGSWDAFRGLRATSGSHDVQFYHTQSVSLFAPVLARKTPYVVSVDATPIQIDQMAKWYGHTAGNGLAESAKRQLYRAVFRRAAAMVAWSNWAADSLVEDYGVNRKRITVAHPGAVPEFFGIPRGERESEVPTILFVGGDLKRKGADVLLAAFQRIQSPARLLFVTNEELPERDGIEVIHGASPNSPELLAAYERADIFCLPSRGDCTPLVLGEAMAAGLPVVTTSIGSNPETVSHGETGLLIERDDVGGLAAALDSLLEDRAYRRAMGERARAEARERFDSERNAGRLMQLFGSLAS